MMEQHRNATNLIDLDLLRKLFPDKAESKISIWLEILHNEELETVSDASVLLPVVVHNLKGSQHQDPLPRPLSISTALAGAGVMSPWDVAFHGKLPAVVSERLKQHFLTLLSQETMEGNAHKEEVSELVVDCTESGVVCAPPVLATRTTPDEDTKVVSGKKCDQPSLVASSAKELPFDSKQQQNSGAKKSSKGSINKKKKQKQKADRDPEAWFELNPTQASRLLYPNPVCFLTTLSAPSSTTSTTSDVPPTRTTNVMTISWLTAANNSGGLVLCINKGRHSAEGLIANGRFTLSVAHYGQKGLLTQIGKLSGRSVNKFHAVEGLRLKRKDGDEASGNLSAGTQVERDTNDGHAPQLLREDKEEKNGDVPSTSEQKNTAAAAAASSQRTESATTESKRSDDLSLICRESMLERCRYGPTRCKWLHDPALCQQWWKSGGALCDAGHETTRRAESCGASTTRTPCHKNHFVTIPSTWQGGVRNGGGKQQPAQPPMVAGGGTGGEQNICSSFNHDDVWPEGIEDAVAVMKCIVLRYSDGADASHHCVIAQVVNAECHPSYWDGKVFAPRRRSAVPQHATAEEGEEEEEKRRPTSAGGVSSDAAAAPLFAPYYCVPPVLTFLGSQIFGAVVPDEVKEHQQQQQQKPPKPCNTSKKPAVDANAHVL